MRRHSIVYTHVVLQDPSGTMKKYTRSRARPAVIRAAMAVGLEPGTVQAHTIDSRTRYTSLL